MSLDGTDVTPLGASGGTMPRWSRQGRIVFQSNRSGNNEIYTMAGDGSDGVQVTTTAAAESMPAWSPDGTQIAYVSADGGRTRILASRTAGGTAICVAGACDTAQEGTRTSAARRRLPD